MEKKKCTSKAVKIAATNTIPNNNKKPTTRENKIQSEMQQQATAEKNKFNNWRKEKASSTNRTTEALIEVTN